MRKIVAAAALAGLALSAVPALAGEGECNWSQSVRTTTPTTTQTAETPRPVAGDSKGG